MNGHNPARAVCRHVQEEELKISAGSSIWASIGFWCSLSLVLGYGNAPQFS